MSACPNLLRAKQSVHERNLKYTKQEQNEQLKFGMPISPDPFSTKVDKHLRRYLVFPIFPPWSSTMLVLHSL